MHMSIVSFVFRFNYLNIYQNWHNNFFIGSETAGAGKNGVSAGHGTESVR
jgi:hypothetical protein